MLFFLFVCFFFVFFLFFVFLFFFILICGIAAMAKSWLAIKDNSQWRSLYHGPCYTEQPQFKINCEILWVKLEVTSVHPLCICAHYNPKKDNQESLLELRRSVVEVKNKAKSNTWILGDFSLPMLTWPDIIPTLKPDCTHKQIFDILDFINDFSLTWMITQPTRYGNILDIFYHKPYSCRTGKLPTWS